MGESKRLERVMVDLDGVSWHLSLRRVSFQGKIRDSHAIRSFFRPIVATRPLFILANPFCTTSRMIDEQRRLLDRSMDSVHALSRSVRASVTSLSRSSVYGTLLNIFLFSFFFFSNEFCDEIYRILFDIIFCVEIMWFKIAMFEKDKSINYNWYSEIWDYNHFFYPLYLNVKF